MSVRFSNNVSKKTSIWFGGIHIGSTGSLIEMDYFLCPELTSWAEKLRDPWQNILLNCLLRLWQEQMPHNRQTYHRQPASLESSRVILGHWGTLQRLEGLFAVPVNSRLSSFCRTRLTPSQIWPNAETQRVNKLFSKLSSLENHIQYSAIMAQDFSDVLERLHRVQGSHSLSILKLSEPISAGLDNNGTYSSDVSADSLENPTPASLEADLAHYKVRLTSI